MPNAEPHRPGSPAQQGKQGGGIVRIVLGIVILAFAVLGTLGNVASGRMVASGGAAETFGAVLGRLIIVALGVLLLVSGLRARRRRSRERPQNGSGGVAPGPGGVRGHTVGP